MRNNVVLSILVVTTLILSILSRTAFGDQSPIPLNQNISNYGSYYSPLLQKNNMACRRDEQGKISRGKAIDQYGLETDISRAHAFLPESGPSLSDQLTLATKVSKSLSKQLRAAVASKRKSQRSSRRLTQIRQRFNTTSTNARNLQLEVSFCSLTIGRSTWRSWTSPTVTPPPTSTPWVPGDFMDLDYTEPTDLPVHTAHNNTVHGVISPGIETIVTLANDRYIKQMQSSSEFAFHDVPEGDYFLRVEAVDKSINASFGPALRVSVTSNREENKVAEFKAQSPTTKHSLLYHWHQDSIAHSGNTFSASNDESKGEQGAANTLSSSNNDGDGDSSSSRLFLKSIYGIELSDSELTWSSETIHRLYSTFYRFMGDMQELPNRAASTWQLSSEEIPDDIEIGSTVEGTVHVRVSLASFAYAEPTFESIDGEKHEFFSQRLFKAVARFVIMRSTSLFSINHLLSTSYRVSILNPYIFEVINESPDDYQNLSKEEIINLVSSLSELPSEMFNKMFGTSTGTFTVLRRKNGHGSIGIKELTAGPTGEVVGLAFEQGELLSPSNELLVKLTGALSAILYRNGLSVNLRQDWLETNGWTAIPGSQPPAYDLPDTSWQPTQCHIKTLAIKKNLGPIDDFSCSFITYLTKPKELLSTSPTRYEFMKSRIFAGYQYRNVIRKDLRFEVLNLNPDTSSPGYPKSIDATLTGSPTTDKTLKIRMTLNGDDPILHGAGFGQLYFEHSLTKKYISVSLFAANANSEGTSLTLQTSARLSKYLPAGVWTVASGTLSDQHGNYSFIRRGQIQLAVNINNTLPLPENPRIEHDSLRINVSNTISRNGMPAGQLEAAIKIANPEMANSVVVQFVNLDSDQFNHNLLMALRPQKDSPTIFSGTNSIPYLPSGRYAITRIWVTTASDSCISSQFSVSPDTPGTHLSPVVDFSATDSDTSKPVLDINDISISARPANPQNPDGKTFITITMKVFDDKSGISRIGLGLIDPKDRYRTFGLNQRPEPGSWATITETIILPAGSLPGNWGLLNIQLEDSTGNQLNHYFAELVRFKVAE